VRLAVAQLDAEPLAPAANAARGARAIDDAAAQGADLVVLPELMSSGYVLDRSKLERVAEQVRAPGEALGAWCDAARRGGATVVAGFAERGDDGLLYDSAAVIDRAGAIAGVYRKLHLFDREHQVFAPGDRGLPVFAVDGLRLGVLVCYDLRFPEAMRLLALQGAQLVAVPAAWVARFDPAAPAPGEPIGQVAAAIVQANLNQVFVAAADRVGADDGTELLGSSVVASPYGERLAGPLDGVTEQVAVVDVELDDHRTAQDRGGQVRPRDDRRADVYGELLGYRGAAPAAASNGAAPHAADLLLEVERKRGYVLDMHRVLAEADPEFLRAYEDLMTAAYTRDRAVDRRTRELVYTAVLTALGSSRGHVAAHMRAALEAGATATELLQVLEQTLPAAGVPRFMAGLDAWKDVCWTAVEEEGAG
jgi:predicted amidohydrolase/alkylhydroperoxidase/carboxymuconolactone decarboxylase family protein YurZ